ncbi:hypothetical protein EYF80_002469 [Liparis tanakae]|uniref:Uncharacterized protein n=1 Tax=Liparis tanakae TaxID=230148 RepID=A0A4Z2JB88_9TELE|nr:hypothetical protein EYF80_002469 [Liparis tanakae]
MATGQTETDTITPLGLDSRWESKSSGSRVMNEKHGPTCHDLRGVCHYILEDFEHAQGLSGGDVHQQLGPGEAPEGSQRVGRADEEYRRSMKSISFN